MLTDRGDSAAAEPRPSSADDRRRGKAARLAVAVAALAVVIVAVTILDAGAPANSAEDELAARLRGATEPKRFAFTYRAGGTRVLDCVLPNRAFTVAVDRVSGVMELRGRPSIPPFAIVWPGREAFLHRSLFADGIVSTTWLRVDHPVGREAAERLRRVLGVDLGGYVLTAELAPSGRATVLAALEVAGDVSRLDGQTPEAGTADGFRITADAEKLDDVTSPSIEVDVDEAASVKVVPVFEVWVDGRGEVVRLDVRPDTPGSEADEAAGGWAVEYSRLSDSFGLRPTDDVTDLADIDADVLRPPVPGGCALPL